MKRLRRGLGMACAVLAAVGGALVVLSTAQAVTAVRASSDWLAGVAFVVPAVLVPLTLLPFLAAWALLGREGSTPAGLIGLFASGCLVAGLLAFVFGLRAWEATGPAAETLAPVFWYLVPAIVCAAGGWSLLRRVRR